LLHVCLLHDNGFLRFLLLVLASVAVIPAAALAEDSTTAHAAKDDTDGKYHAPEHEAYDP